LECDGGHLCSGWSGWGVCVIYEFGIFIGVLFLIPELGLPPHSNIDPIL
jgi:hypothetical protein